MSGRGDAAAVRARVELARQAVIDLAEHAKDSDELLTELVRSVIARRVYTGAGFWDGGEPMVQLTLRLTEAQVAHLEEVTGRAITTHTAVSR